MEHDYKRVEETIDKIEAVRARSNVLWMNVVRLAMRLDPAAARAIFDEIEANDEEILRLSRWMRTGRASSVYDGPDQTNKPSSASP